MHGQPLFESKFWTKNSLQLIKYATFPGFFRNCQGSHLRNKKFVFNCALIYTFWKVITKIIIYLKYWKQEARGLISVNIQSTSRFLRDLFSVASSCLFLIWVLNVLRSRSVFILQRCFKIAVSSIVSVNKCSLRISCFLWELLSSVLTRKTHRPFSKSFEADHVRLSQIRPDFSNRARRSAHTTRYKPVISSCNITKTWYGTKVTNFREKNTDVAIVHHPRELRINDRILDEVHEERDEFVLLALAKASMI